MGDPDRDEPSEPDAESEPESDRSEDADAERRKDDAERGEQGTDEGESSEPTSYDLDDEGLFPGPESFDSNEEDGNADDGADGAADDSEVDDDGEVDAEDAAAINEGTSPRPNRRRMRPKREGKDDGTDDEDDDDDDDEDDDDEDDQDDDDEDVEEVDDETVSNGAGAVATERDDDEPLFEGPESDEEMPLADHIEEMMRRLGVVFLVAGIATLIAYPSADIAINYFWSSHIPDPGVNRPRVYGPLEFILTKLKVAGLAGLVFGLPVFVYETYLFMRPGLYPRERRYYLAAIPTSLVLATIGGLFAHFVVLPAIFAYFTAYTEGTAVIAFGLAETFNLIVVLIGYMAVVFQIPLLIMLAIMMNLVTREWLEDKRLLFWGGFLGLSWLVTPDPTGMAPIIVTLTMIGLYEGTLALLRWTGN
ncbi:Sec-independent protein secretion pathway component TatC [Halalkaliarchaeum sp. AArc-CO]|uniref:twin-arginine translocase subunit TatC n=1 Tax=unclassified Halalkaliarchaeum TaxID=2678344 RepID=UPI00217CDCCD|nr:MULTISPECIES: twin-arginine translocase subunit TatC [unclassified Halalkaliarchaeum]MDR5673384.1 twin-arginine translocase subunit TatC [Halalkaliarchaeum sp. AArc-GB]UWG49725.1 Sec-independent protein secretion pathway component TatC [Halalkaliarchaeum sp. AArc-CO]